MFAKHGTKAKAVLLSIVQREAKMAWSFLGEGFDLSGDAAVFAALIAVVGKHLKPAHKAAASAFLRRIAGD